METTYTRMLSFHVGANLSQHWFIQDFPRVSSPSQETDGSETEFESILLNHITSLAAPDVFVSSIRGKFDYSEAAVSIIPSKPGAFSGDDAQRYGQTRLKKLAKELIEAEEKTASITLECFTG